MDGLDADGGVALVDEGVERERGGPLGGVYGFGHVDDDAQDVAVVARHAVQVQDAVIGRLR